MKNFHLSRPEDVYDALSQEAERSKRSATSIARHQAIAEFARDFAGTELDLDPQLEAAGLEYLLDHRSLDYLNGNWAAR